LLAQDEDLAGLEKAMSFFPPEKRPYQVLSLAVIILLFTLFDSAEAQSGRRAMKTQPAGTPSPSPALPITENEASLPPLGSLQNKVKLFIGRQPTQRHLQSEDVILASFVKRLNQYRNISATSVGDLSQKQAVQRARNEAQSFMVMLNFEIDTFQGGTIVLNSPDLQIEYKVLAPRTGKEQTKGKVYFQSIGGGRMRKSDWPGGTPIRITADAAGIEAADHIYDFLRLDEMRKRQGAAYRWTIPVRRLRNLPERDPSCA
jgi:hypothetical protein